jgi:hypothetical protein
VSDNSLEAIIADHVAEEKATEAPTESVEPTEPEEVVKENTEEEEADKADSGEEVVETEEPQENPEVVEIREAMQQRINRQTAAYKDLQEKMNAMQAEMEKVKAQPEPTTTSELKAPSLEDFDDIDDYHQAMTEHAEAKAAKLAEDKLANMQNEMKQREAMELEARNMEAFNQRVESFKEQAPDFDDKAQFFMENAQYLVNHGGANAQSVDIIGKYIQQADLGPRLVYELANNPEKMEAISKMEPFAALESVFELKRGSRKSPAPAKPDRKPTPKPIKALGGSGQAAIADDDQIAENILKSMGI